MSTPHVLVIAYCFPPHGAVGTLRTLRLVRRLCQDGCTVTVVTGDPATYRPGTPVDRTLLDAVPEEVRVIRVRSRLPRLAGLLATPDRDVGWLVPATRHAIAVCRASRPDVLYSSAPPWTTQVVARVVAAVTGVPWVADFRDPWSRGPWREDRPVSQKVINGWLERTTVKRASALLCTTDNQRDELVGHHGRWLESRIRVVANGCDPAELEEVAASASLRPHVLLHAGSLYGARSPVPLLRAIAALAGQGDIRPGGFTLRLLGQVALNGTALDTTVRDLGVRDFVELRPRVGRSESLREMAAASSLLLLQPEHPLSIPAKAFEYLAAGRPILAVTDGGATSDLMRASGSALVVASDDQAGLERALRALVVGGWTPSSPAPRDLYDGGRRAAEMSAIVQEAARA